MRVPSMIVALLLAFVGPTPARAAAQTESRFESARALERAGDIDGALAAYEQLAGAPDAGPDGDAALYHAGRLAERHLGDLERALRHYRELPERFPESRWLESAAPRIRALEAMLAEGPATGLAYERLLRRHTLGELDRAATARALSELVEAAPSSYVVPAALAWIADAEARAGHAERAERRYRELLSRFPGSPAARAARRALGDLAFQRFDHRAAIEHYEALFPARSPLEAMNLSKLIERAEGHLERRRWLAVALAYLAGFCAVATRRALRAGTLAAGAVSAGRELSILLPALAAIAALAMPNGIIVRFVLGLAAVSAVLTVVNVASLRATPARRWSRRLQPIAAAAAVMAAAYAILYWLDLAFVLEGNWT